MILMKKRCGLGNQKGFTLIELISVIIIMGVMGSVSIKKFDLLSDTAAARVLTDSIKELNIRESMTWIDLKFSADSTITDEEVFAAMDPNLGSDYVWIEGPNASGGKLSFRYLSATLVRTPSTNKSPATWN